MLDTQSPLISEFLKDHQQFSRLMLEIKKLVDEGEIELAKVRAEELDELAGGHIAYEEAELYPRLAKLTDKAVSEEKLVGQHHEVLSAVKILIGDAAVSPEDLVAVQAALEVGLAHAEHCGSLISLMSTLDKEEQEASLVELRRLRDSGTKWSEMKTSN